MGKGEKEGKGGRNFFEFGVRKSSLFTAFVFCPDSFARGRPRSGDQKGGGVCVKVSLLAEPLRTHRSLRFEAFSELLSVEVASKHDPASISGAEGRGGLNSPPLGVRFPIGTQESVAPPQVVPPSRIRGGPKNLLAF